ncbi:MAG: hypothetical protein HWQ38_09365 [Nostoc sp. NMS7]|uniref:hypothetical protein n=1 Tax=Nostoc sp. NMS7 TaxID=2815391 RepID=UPI0025F5FF5B|nr:hypothetical protein [Nostoc sp. NMS7]MBN3946681.1 hypothetical protein [Nostoc sp. NMS7]
MRFSSFPYEVWEGIHCFPESQYKASGEIAAPPKAEFQLERFHPIFGSGDRASWHNYHRTKIS